MIPSELHPASAPRAWVDVDLDALVANGRRVANVSGARLLPMVKANGYGLGAVAVARALEALDPWGFGVATVEEGAELRAAGIERPIIVFTPLVRQWIPGMIAARLRPLLCDPAATGQWIEAAPGLPFHIGIDTGMARAGVPCDDRPALAAMASSIAGDRAYEGACTHFHSADADPASVGLQRLRFMDAVRALGPRPPLLHLANSAAALLGSEVAADLVRPGIFLYGGRAGGHVPATVATLRAIVVSVRRARAGETVSYGAAWRAPRDTTLATLAIGYADGLLRSLSDRGVVDLGGARAPIRGRVTMDMTVVEAPPEARIGDVATLWGGSTSLDEQAAAAGTISYELLTALGARVRRAYGPAS